MPNKIQARMDKLAEQRAPLEKRNQFRQEVSKARKNGKSTDEALEHAEAVVFGKKGNVKA